MNKKVRFTLVAVFAFAGVLTGVTTAADDKRLLTLADRDRLKSPGSPVIAPDGDVAFTLDDRIHVVDSRQVEARPVTTIGKAWNPEWSADGRSLYFLSDRSGSAQLWRLAKDRLGEAEQLTSFDKVVSAIELSPDETRLLLIFSDKALKEPATENDEPPPPFVVRRRQFKRDAGDGYLTDDDRRHLYVLDIGKSELTALTGGTFEETAPAWSPNGERVVFVSNREVEPDASYRSDIWVVDVDGMAAPRRLTDDGRTNFSPAFSPDGRHVAYLSAEDGVYGVPHIALVPAGGGEPRLLTESLDRTIGGFRYSPDGRYIYFRYDNRGSIHLARVKTDNGRIETIVDSDGTVAGFDVRSDGELALAMQGKNDLLDIFRLHGRKLTQLSRVNDELFAEIFIGEKRKVTFASRDGTEIDAFITTPRDYEAGKRYPTVLKIHGGPVAQFAWGYAFETQYLAANGYVVVEPNPRGSTGFGQDFIRAIYRTWGITDYDDVIAAIDYAIDAGIADPERLAVTGYSYGGYMTNTVITSTGRFRAAASGAGHSLIEANFGHDIYQQWYVWELGVPWAHRERYDRLSPFLRAGNITTPTIFLGGRIDWNVPVLNAELMYQAMQVRGIDTELVVYPGAHHGGWPTAYENDYLSRMVDWFDRYLK